MSWEVLDITKSNFRPGSFDVVLDKSTLDAMMGQYDLNAIVNMLCETHVAMSVGVCAHRRHRNVLTTAYFS